jgi:hypothetical protein
MRPNSFSVLVLVAVFTLAACSVNVKKNEQGEDKNVDIKTPFAEIHVDKNADAGDTGLPVYPGAKLKEQTAGNDEKSANVNISAFGFGLKVVALEYESTTPPSKIVAYYKEQLKKYGNVLECRTQGRNYNYDTDSEELKCEGSNSGKTVELKAGTRSNQHIVSIEPQGQGTDFALVYVHTRGKDDTI